MTQNTDHQEFNLIKSEHKDLFTNQIVQSGNILSQSGLYTLLKDNPGFLQLNEKIVTSLADIFTARENNRYNNSLTWLEKNFKLFAPSQSSEKLRLHNEKLGRINEGAALTAAALQLSPILLDVSMRWYQASKYREFFTQWLAYINGTNNVRTQRAVQALCKEHGIAFNEAKYIEAFNRHIDCDPSKKLAVPSKLTSKEDCYKVFSFIIRHSDVSNAKVRERCEAFGDYLDLPKDVITNGIEVSQDTLQATSDQCSILSWGFGCLLAELPKTLKHAEQYSNYALHNDIYAAQRERNGRIILGAGTIAVSALSLSHSGMVLPILQASQPLFEEILLGEPGDPDAISKQLYIRDRIRQAG